MNNITRITTALRMRTSQQQPASARFTDDSALASKEAAIKAGWPLKQVIEVSPDISNKDLQELSLPKPYALVVIKGLGGVLTAASGADVEYALANQSFPTSPHIPTGRVAGRVAIVTGAAQGFGQGIAEELFEQGANVVIADLNQEKGSELAQSFNDKKGSNRALFLRCDVSDADSVEEMVNTTALFFGGVDLLVSNAGILRAGGLDEMDPKVFELMTKVNYNGFFHCAKAGASVMKLQSEFNPAHFSDIIQINSKSGLKGSNKNFAYAGAKFGGIGLTQSFALELMPYRIKVNAVCPGNFFEGPLWSDPQNGLFVQYLNAGKIPGAKTLADVKDHYESQVPAGRGCRVKDVARAILYAVEQEYETGQAIPVTGGQNMLS